MPGRTRPTPAPLTTPGPAGDGPPPGSNQVEPPAGPTGGFVTRDGEVWYRIAGVHRMPPFLMTLPGDTDLWMFVTSTGGLTAGRVDAEGSLFPYETVDRLYDAHHHTGPVTLLRPRRPGSRGLLWEPLTDRTDEDFDIERNLYKNTIGHCLVFEEVNRTLGLTFRYRWSLSDEFGLVRTATLINDASEPRELELLDGLRNILPFGAPLALYQQSSSLVDAYKRVDFHAGERLAVYSLTARITDRPEPAEQLRANVVWSLGHGEEMSVALDGAAVSEFRRGRPIAGPRPLTGRRGHYLIHGVLTLPPGGRRRWHIGGDVGRSHVDIAGLRARLRGGPALDGEIEASLQRTGANLMAGVGSADGLQVTGRPATVVHHFANVLFNNMRGGVPVRHGDLPTADFADFARARHRPVVDRQAAFWAGLPEWISTTALRARAAATGDADLERLGHEYLPLWFGRRHGDPSRPWNRFAIQVRDGRGGRALRYEGNWRDIFQNWEALSLSFPTFRLPMIARFVNASTVDGFNPYRISRDGIDWEVDNPDHPWSNIGYWGDHQIVYLLRLLEAEARTHPGALESMLAREIFSYADVPYRIRPYEEILADPRATIVFDRARARRIDERVRAIGADGKLLSGGRGAVHHVSLLEKLLVPALARLSNFVPDGGIWMNTQRPEWNDANNALAGQGLSMVTVCHLRRYLEFLEGLVAGAGLAAAPVSIEVVGWLRRIHPVLAVDAGGEISDRERKVMLDALGHAFADYRRDVYERGFSGQVPLRTDSVIAFCRAARDLLDRAILRNRRDDGLYHAYNLLEFSPDGLEAAVRPLDEMLEGQVAALSSGLIEGEEADRLIAALFQSRLYRPDQRSFLLYPERTLPAFVDRNVVATGRVLEIPLLGRLLDQADRSIIARDADGRFRFHADFANAGDLAAALDRLAGRDEWRDAVARDQRAVLDLFEEVFHHRSFTGRSGTMYGYEGLGCVYWHMVAKLLVAVQETALRAERAGRPATVVEALRAHYGRIRAGLGFEKSVAEYGAFPTDPYSHTPRHAGAQQPGMTGQVKEEILTRFGELGVVIEAGEIAFQPFFLCDSEFLVEPGRYHAVDRGGRTGLLELPVGALAFSLGQVPVIYTRAGRESWVRVTRADGTSATRPGDRLNATESREVFARSGAISRIDVGIPDERIQPG